MRGVEMNSTRRKLLESLVGLISDYRVDDPLVPTMDPTHVSKWVRQFDDDAQDTILSEMAHVLSKTYFSKNEVKSFLAGLIGHKAFGGTNPAKYWRAVNIFREQAMGESQTDLLKIFDGLLDAQVGFKSTACGGGDCFLYLDDGIFSGGHIIADLAPWIRKSAPSKCAVTVVVIALHLGGRWNAQKELKEVADSCGKSVDLSDAQWWSIRGVENRLRYKDNSDVLWPVAVPDDEDVQKYAQSVTHPKFGLPLRKPGKLGNLKCFSSDEARNILEHEFLVAGVRIRQMCPYLNDYQRPLGNMVLSTLGFGAMVVTFRNCPNNCPLAWWAGDPWYPLFPRKTN